MRTFGVYKGYIMKFFATVVDILLFGVLFLKPGIYRRERKAYAFSSARFAKTLFFTGAVLFLPMSLSASIIDDIGNIFGGGGGGGCSAGDAGCPIELTVSGDKATDQNPDKFYKFILTMSQDISIDITNHDNPRVFTDAHDLTITLHPMNNDGSCNTSQTIAQKTSDAEIFSLGQSALAGGKTYCIEMSGYTGSWASNADKFDIQVNGAADLKAGISDASAQEDNGPMTFYVALTKASPSDVTIHYTFQDGSAKNGVNYIGTNGSVTIPAGSLSATFDVPLIDTGMTVSKTFTVTIDSSDVPISSESKYATGTIIGSNSEDADDAYEGPDICYESRKDSGFCMFGSCMFYKQETVVKAMVEGVENIHIQKALTRGIAFMNFFSEIGIDGSSRTGQIDSDEAENKQFMGFDFIPNSYYLASMFPGGVDYRIGHGAINPTSSCINGPKVPWYNVIKEGTPIDPPASNECEVQGGSLSKGETASYYDKALLKLGLFTQYTHLVTYTKDGTTYQEVLQPCNTDEYGTLDNAPNISGCGVFVKALNSPKFINCQGDCNDTTTAMNLVLPTFRTSQVSDSTPLEYSGVISKQQVGNVIVGHGSEHEDTKHIVFEAPYSKSYGKRVMFIKKITDHDSDSGTYHYVFGKGGDYWIENWDIDGKSGKTVVIETDAKASSEVRIFINSDLALNAQSIVIKNSDSGHKFHIYIYGSLHLNGQGGNEIDDGYIYANDIVNLDQTTTLQRGAIATKENLITDGGSFSYPPDTPETDIYDVCPAFDGNFITGPFDAWDNFRSQLDNNISDRHLSTKIAGQDFILTVGSLNKDLDAVETKPGVDIRFALYDTGSGTYKRVEAWRTFNAEAAAKIHPSYTDIDKAHTNMRMIFKVCADYNASSGLYHYVGHDICGRDCSTNTEETVDSPCFRYFKSTDDFAVRPDKYDVNLTSSTKIIASKSINLKFDALTATGSVTPDYNATEGATAPFVMTSDLYESGKQCEATSASHAPDINFTNGTFTHDIAFDHVGKFTVSIHESNNCNERFAKTDCSDPSAGVWATDDTAITPKEVNITIIPDHFDIKNGATFERYPSSTFTYLSNFNNSDGQQMASDFNVTIVAKKANNVRAVNYAKTCYAKDIDTTLLYRLSDGSGTTVTPNLTNTQYIEKSVDTGIQEVSITSDITHPFAKDVFDEEENGTANIILSINFDRQYNTPVNPFMMTLDTLKIKDADDVKGEPAVNLSSNYVYGKARSSKAFYDDITQSSIVTPIEVVLYCQAATCPGVLTGSSYQTNESYWYLSSNHDISKGDGSVTLISSINGTVAPSDPTSITPSSGVDDSVTVTHNGSTYPDVVTIDFGSNTNSWLIYNKNANNVLSPFYRVRFIGTGNWAGEGQTGHVVNGDTNKKKSKRLEW